MIFDLVGSGLGQPENLHLFGSKKTVLFSFSTLRIAAITEALSFSSSLQASFYSLALSLISFLA